jgi:hypothetical protein
MKLLTLILLLTGCVTAPIEAPKEEKPVTPVNLENACVKRYWKDRGYLPKGFAQGVAQSYLRARARGEKGRPLASPDKDALAYYKLGAGNELEKTYAFLLGLGMRESNGNYSLGRDYTAKGPQSSKQAESGAWQFSFDAIGRDGELRKIYSDRSTNQTGSKSCLNEVYAVGIKKRETGYITSPADGYAFQKFFRGCADAQAEYAAVMIRAVRSHFGPINRREVEYVKACEDWLKSL